ncbi:MAG: hypothetical protein ACLTZY_05725 [Alistipes indistinctus]
MVNPGRRFPRPIRSSPSTGRSKIRCATTGPAGGLLFKRGIAQSLIRQYTGSISNYTAAIDLDPSIRSCTSTACDAERNGRLHLVDRQRLPADYGRTTIRDQRKRLKSSSSRSYGYDDAIADLNKAARLFPEFAYIYYNRANLLCRSGRIPEALEDYTKASN